MREMSVPVDGDVINYLVPDSPDVTDAVPVDFAGAVEYLNVDARERALRAIPYDEYLKSPHWHATRKAALGRAGNRCERCGTWKKLQVHHLTYDRRGREEDSDLLVLCRDCHEAEHKISGEHA